MKSTVLFERFEDGVVISDPLNVLSKHPNLVGEYRSLNEFTYQAWWINGLELRLTQKPIRTMRKEIIIVEVFAGIVERGYCVYQVHDRPELMSLLGGWEHFQTLQNEADSVSLEYGLDIRLHII